MAESRYILTVGLEVHAELRTKTKVFCSSKNDPDEKRPNVNVCPVCMGYPGTLPVINHDAVLNVLKVGVAIDGTLASFTEFDRKNYFYPDIPKGYQISQYKYPLVSGGTLAGVAITRIHLEEDTARSAHDVKEVSLIDFNRAGLPLMELVTEPVIHSAEDAGRFARELQLLLRTLGVAEANMEKGEMRVEANISIAPEGELGTKVEVKNLNSFRSVERAIAYEARRQEEILDRGEKIIQETRGWDDTKGITFSQRLKEDSHDYRYFPDPDLPKLNLAKIPHLQKDIIKASLPELPWDQRSRYTRDWGLKDEDVEVYVSNPQVRSFFEAVAANLSGRREAVILASNYITSDLIGMGLDFSDTIKNLAAESFSELILMLTSKEVSSRAGKDILAIMVKEGGNPRVIAGSQDLLIKTDLTYLRALIDKIISDNPNVVADFQKGKESSLQFLVGQGMRASRGSADPLLLKKLIVESIGDIKS